MTSLPLPLKRLSKSRFFRDVATVMTGTTIAQIIGFLLMPLISRLFSPADFGLFGSFLSLSCILSTIATLQYQQALMLPREDYDAYILFIVTLASAVIFCVTLVLFTFLFQGYISIVFPLFRVRLMPLFLSFSVFLNSTSQAFLSWGVRRKSFIWTGISHIHRSFAAFSLQVIAGIFNQGATGLIAGSMLGDFAVSLTLWYVEIRKTIFVFSKRFSRIYLLKLFYEYKAFPLYCTPQSLLNSLSHNTPILIIGFYYSPVIAGFYALGIRVLQVPMNFILNGLKQVLFQRVSSAYNNQRDIRPYFYITTLSLALIALPPALVGFIFSPSLFSFLFGANWAEAGVYARWLIFWYSVSFCNLPSYILAQVLGQQKSLFYFEVISVTFRSFILIVGGLYFKPLSTIIYFSIAGALLNISLILWTWYYVVPKK